MARMKGNSCSFQFVIPKELNERMEHLRSTMALPSAAPILRSVLTQYVEAFEMVEKVMREGGTMEDVEERVAAIVGRAMLTAFVPSVTKNPQSTIGMGGG